MPLQLTGVANDVRINRWLQLPPPRSRPTPPRRSAPVVLIMARAPRGRPPAGRPSVKADAGCGDARDARFVVLRTMPRQPQPDGVAVRHRRCNPGRQTAWHRACAWLQARCHSRRVQMRCAVGGIGGGEGWFAPVQRRLHAVAAAMARDCASPAQAAGCCSVHRVGRLVARRGPSRDRTAGARMRARAGVAPSRQSPAAVDRGATRTQRRACRLAACI